MSEATKAAIAEMIAHVLEECEPFDAEAAVAELMDAEYEKDRFFLRFGPTPSRVLREMEPTTFRCMVADYTGTSDDLYEIEGEYYGKREVDNAAEEFIDDMETRLEELEDERDDLEAEDDDDNAGRLAELAQEIAELAANITACNRHAW